MACPLFRKKMLKLSNNFMISYQVSKSPVTFSNVLYHIITCYITCPLLKRQKLRLFDNFISSFFDIIRWLVSLNVQVSHHLRMLLLSLGTIGLQVPLLIKQHKCYIWINENMTAGVVVKTRKEFWKVKKF